MLAHPTRLRMPSRAHDYLWEKREDCLFQAPRGTADILPEEQSYWRFCRSKARETATSFGYRRIDTPLFEDAGLFVRGVGEVTDIVEKETYTFEDRGGAVAMASASTPMPTISISTAAGIESRCSS